MSQAAKIKDAGHTSAQSSFDGDVLRFLKRTIQFHSADAEAQEVFAKLQNLKNALDQQENTVLGWPDSPSKDRICEALARAKALVAQIADDYGSAEKKHSAAGGAQARSD